MTFIYQVSVAVFGEDRTQAEAAVWFCFSSRTLEVAWNGRDANYALPRQPKQPKNHTVTQSSFLSPCSPLRNGSLTGFDSGYVPVDSGAKEAPAWTLEITQDASPIWFYCATGTHCQSGMVGA